jgi:hypothetical protein
MGRKTAFIVGIIAIVLGIFGWIAWGVDYHLIIVIICGLLMILLSRFGKF